MEEPSYMAGILLDQLHMRFLSDCFPVVLLYDRLFFHAQLFSAFWEGREDRPMVDLEAFTGVDQCSWEHSLQVSRPRRRCLLADNAGDFVATSYLWRPGCHIVGGMFLALG